MSDPTRFVDLATPVPKPGAINPDATIIEGITLTGKPCRIVDNTGSVDHGELQETLDRLIEQKQFGLGGLSAKGGNTISLETPASSHIQFGATLYRILLFPYEARIEKF